VITKQLSDHSSNTSRIQTQKSQIFYSGAAVGESLHGPEVAEYEYSVPTDISQYRLRFGSSLLYKSVFHLIRLTAQLSYEGRAAVEGGK
jgi:hypothetical protein